MAHELTCKSKHFLFRPFGADFLLHQRLSAPLISPRASACYKPIQDMESKQLLFNLLCGKEFSSEFDRFAASVVYTLTFGLRIVDGNEWQLREGQECIKNLLKAAKPGAWIVDILPFLNHLPAPLAPWKKTAEEWYQQWTDLHIKNLQDALKRKGWNWAKELVKAKGADNVPKIDLAWDLGISCDGGVETTSVQLRILILACLTYPEWVATAQKQLDHVVGSTRLPDYDDLDRLPYIHAVIEELFRWRHIVPGGIPHATTQDDYYDGYLIPKNSTIIPLYHAMGHDTQRFKDPTVFRPERWLTASVPGNTGNFGYGRRICPGRFIARNSLTIVIARLLWAFDVQPQNGEVMAPVPEDGFTDGLVSEPVPFGAVFRVRSVERKNVIEEDYESVDKDTCRLLERVKAMRSAAGLGVRG